MDESLSLLFPTEVWQFKSDNIDNKNLLSSILKDEKKEDSLHYSNVGGWRSADNLHLDSRFSGVVDFIIENFDCICKRNNYIDNLIIKINAMWSMVNRNNHSNVNHVHPRFDWSFCYYINTPIGCGNIVFVDPRIRKTMVNQSSILSNYENPSTHEIYFIAPIAGLLIIFPSYLEHYVEPNLSEEVRVSLSGNIILEKG